ncbi:GIY-YIG nuclease family protein [Paeniglutamicibacter sp. ABSL32-1]|uniref:GIY-YIG nuclease family protein n=1 Tax=Paeniglutamicibacter quisquiliarum TaxID=2849498 RepID=UPI001C2D49F0|nr:GIY-YIG nuclease family protein [Paeniglutamicibacter quisquiliarum]MBV1780833.1 GIY-YIG nuclease family protein [Paeniglutamicibacter quisquiliarum]
MNSFDPPMDITVDHFGEPLRPGKYGHRLVRERYAIIKKLSSFYPDRSLYTDEYWDAVSWRYDDENHRILSDKYCELLRKAAVENFDLNMAFFKQLDPAEFEQALDAMLAKHKKLRPVTDLRTLDGVQGVYVMVLDEHRQAYVGQARDVRKRIRGHWSGTKSFDRLIFGSPQESVLSIDSFRGLDTTRIYAMPTARSYEFETKIVDAFPPDFLLNRMGGGEVTGLRGVFLAAEAKRRNLLPSDVDELPADS